MYRVPFAWFGRITVTAFLPVLGNSGKWHKRGQVVVTPVFSGRGASQAFGCLF